MKINITPEMLSLIAEIDEFKGAWQLLGRLSPERLQILRKVATIESIGSSTRIEGVQLSDREVEQLLANIDTHSFVSRDEQEIAGYARVCQEVFQHFEHIDFTENVIKQLHGWLLSFSHKDSRHKGEYKKLPNNIEAFDAHGKSIGIIFVTTSPFDTPKEMAQLVIWTQQQLLSKELHPLLVIGIFIVIFLAIHPFQDGNGRLSRVLTTLLLLKMGYTYVPYSSLESVIERNKESYYAALRKTQTSLKSDGPNFEPWLLFFFRSLQKQKVHLEQKISQEKMLMRSMSELASTIVRIISEHGVVSISDIEKMTGANRNTLKKHLAELVAQGTIVQLGTGKATKYSLV